MSDFYQLEHVEVAIWRVDGTGEKLLPFPGSAGVDGLAGAEAARCVADVGIRAVPVATDASGFLDWRAMPRAVGVDWEVTLSNPAQVVVRGGNADAVRGPMLDPAGRYVVVILVDLPVTGRWERQQFFYATVSQSGASLGDKLVFQQGMTLRCRHREVDGGDSAGSGGGGDAREGVRPATLAPSIGGRVEWVWAGHRVPIYRQAISYLLDSEGDVVLDSDGDAILTSDVLVPQRVNTGAGRLAEIDGAGVVTWDVLPAGVTFPSNAVDFGTGVFAGELISNGSTTISPRLLRSGANRAGEHPMLEFWWLGRRYGAVDAMGNATFPFVTVTGDETLVTDAPPFFHVGIFYFNARMAVTPELTAARITGYVARPGPYTLPDGMGTFLRPGGGSILRPGGGGVDE